MMAVRMAADRAGEGGDMWERVAAANGGGECSGGGESGPVDMPVERAGDSDDTWRMTWQ